MGIWLQFASNCERAVEKQRDWANLHPHNVSHTFPSLLPTPLAPLGTAGSVAGETHGPSVVSRRGAGEEVEVRARAWVHEHLLILSFPGVSSGFLRRGVPAAGQQCACRRGRVCLLQNESGVRCVGPGPFRALEPGQSPSHAFSGPQVPTQSRTKGTNSRPRSASPSRPEQNCHATPGDVWGSLARRGAAGSSPSCPQPGTALPTRGPRAGRVLTCPARGRRAAGSSRAVPAGRAPSAARGPR